VERRVFVTHVWDCGGGVFVTHVWLPFFQESAHERHTRLLSSLLLLRLTAIAMRIGTRIALVLLKQLAPFHRGGQERQ
jgi:hypothetical protein